MKILHYLILLLFSISCSNESKETEFKIELHKLQLEVQRLDSINEILETEIKAKNPEVFQNEDFKNFLWEFMTNPEFQKKRIKFPLKYITWKEFIGEQIDTIEIEKNEWAYESFYITTASERTQIYDNFELKFQPTNERLLHWYGVENGGDVKFYFKGFEGKWYLVMKKQLGD